MAHLLFLLWHASQVEASRLNPTKDAAAAVVAATAAVGVEAVAAAETEEAITAEDGVIVLAPFGFEVIGWGLDLRR
jgi:hypothetical protein